MIGNLENIEHKKIFVPEIWNNDWDAIINSSEGTGQELLIFQARAALMLQKVNGTKVNFARLGWLNLWTKGFNILDGVVCAISCNSELTLELLTRVIMEYELHVATIFDNSLSKKNQNKSNITVIHKSESLKAEIINRLRAYAAWGLYCDKDYVEYCVRPNILKGIYDSTPSKEYIDNFENKEDLQQFERLFGEAPVDLDNKSLKRQSWKMHNYGKANIDHINKLLKNNSELKEWYKKIVSIFNKKKKNGYASVSFYEMFDESERSICKKLDKMGMKFGYTSYKLGSMYLHGSTFSNFFLFDSKSIMPKIATQKNEMASKASFIGSRCNSIFVMLATIQSKLWRGEKA